MPDADWQACDPNDTSCLCTSPSVSGFLRSCFSASCPVSSPPCALRFTNYLCARPRSSQLPRHTLTMSARMEDRSGPAVVAPRAQRLPLHQVHLPQPPHRALPHPCQLNLPRLLHQQPLWNLPRVELRPLQLLHLRKAKSLLPLNRALPLRLGEPFIVGFGLSLMKGLLRLSLQSVQPPVRTAL